MLRRHRISLTVSGVVLAAVMTASGARADDMAMWGMNWTGPYVGINGGWSWNDTHFQYTTAPFNTVRPNGTGGMAGGTVGVNWQFEPHWLVGGETDFDWTDIGGSAPCPAATYSCRTNMQVFGTMRARGGYVWDRLLIFGTAGGAVSNVNSRTVFLAGTPQPPSGTPVNGETKGVLGWTAGAGVEYAVWNRLSVKGEALYYDMGSSLFAVDNGLSAHTNEHGILARVGLNWNFGAPSPPPAPVVVPAVAPAPPPPKARVFLVYFDFDRYDLTKEGRLVIEEAAKTFHDGGYARIELTGYTDLAGTQEYNLRLSQRRANIVADAMARLDVPRQAMNVRWRGKENPRVATPDGMRDPDNRRVEIVMP